MGQPPEPGGSSRATVSVEGSPGVLIEPALSVFVLDEHSSPNRDGDTGPGVAPSVQRSRLPLVTVGSLGS